jgi:N-acetylneuraminate synthase
VTGEHQLWGGRTLYDLYTEAHTPWEWHGELFEFAEKNGIFLFSTPFDSTAVDLLESLNTPLYKIASLETGDLGLIRKIAMQKKPILASTGASTLDEIDELVDTVVSTGNRDLTLLLCTSAYPTELEGVNLRRLSLLKSRYNLPVGLSDHTISLEASVGAISLGATVIERHFTLSRSDGGADAAFSLEPNEFLQLSRSIINVSRALGNPNWDVNPAESESRRFRRSLFVVEDVKKGDLITELNVRSIRPSTGLAPKFLPHILGKEFVSDFSVYKWESKDSSDFCFGPPGFERHLILAGSEERKLGNARDAHAQTI